MDVIEQAPLALDADSQIVHSEERIERIHRASYLEYGIELANIRRLLKSAPDHLRRYGTWERYALDRWGLDERRVNQIIEVAIAAQEMGKIFPVLPSRESQVRELLKLPKPEWRAEVWQRAMASAESDGKVITAKIVENEVERKLAELKKDWLTLAEWQEMAPADQRRALTQPYGSGGTFNETNDNIEWAAWSWNPVTGCELGCSYCYARDIANRFYPHKFVPTIYPARLVIPKFAKPGRPRWEGDAGQSAVFVCSMADLFGGWVPDEWIDAVLAAVRGSPEWTFIFLTKNPRRLAEIDWPDNAWVGTTVDTQARAGAAEAAFRNVKARVRFLSCEPFRERLTFPDLSMFNWIILGGQSATSGEPARQPEWGWVEDVLWQARNANCQVYMKPNLTVRAREYPTE